MANASPENATPILIIRIMRLKKSQKTWKVSPFSNLSHQGRILSIRCYGSVSANLDMD
jgi:hypothetical protein